MITASYYAIQCSLTIYHLIHGVSHLIEDQEMDCLNSLASAQVALVLMLQAK